MSFKLLGKMMADFLIRINTNSVHKEKGMLKIMIQVIASVLQNVPRRFVPS